MRPINRGMVPWGEAGPVVFAKYQEARDHLIQRMGDYCSYCEIALHAAIAVEHIQPQKLYPELECVWDNFLLACPNCNSIKLHTDVVVADYFWPHLDNTARLFAYAPRYPPMVVADLSATHQTTAQRTLELTGLDRVPGHPQISPKDRRWQKRNDVAEIALRYRHELQINDTVTLRNAVAMIAISRGFWSVWMAVFHDDVDMKRRLIAAFTGTATDCFDELGNAVRRPGRPV